jgi:lysophosphatidate acyltransferase
MVFLWAIIKPLAYLSLPAIFLHSIAHASPTGRYYVRVGIYVLNLTLAGVWAACVAAGMSLVGRRYDVNWVVAQTFYFLAGRSLGIEVEVEGEEHLQTRPAVFMCNHQTMVDVLVLGR